MDRKKIENCLRTGLVFLFIFFSCNPEQKPGNEIPDWANSINEQVKTWVDTKSVLSADLLIIRNNKTILHNVYGCNDIDENIPLEKNRLFRVHSMTKPFTGTAVLILAEEGKLDIEDKVSKYLAAYQNDKCQDITIRQLLEHTAGFTQPAYPKGSIDLYNSLEEAVTDLAGHGPKYTPGKEYHYSDGHSASLGLIVTKVSGVPVEQFIQERIFAPLGMTDSYCLLEDGKPDRERVCDTYYWKEGKYQKLWDNHDKPETPFFRASGGIITTVEDYAKFLALWLNKGGENGVQLLSEPTVLEALSTNNIHNTYGWHWEIYQASSNPDSLPVFGHGGSSGTLAIAVPEENTMIFYFTQSRGTLTANFLSTFILEELGYVEKKNIPGIKLSEKTVQKYTGEFLIGKETWTVEPTKNGLCLKSGRLVPIEFLPVSDSVFVQRFMDMKLEFMTNAKDSCHKFIFNIDKRKIEATRVLNKK